MDDLTLTYSLADQDFSRTKSVGIFNLSTQLLSNLIRRVNFAHLTVLSNSSLKDLLALPAEVIIQLHNEAGANKLSRVIWDQRGVYQAARQSANCWLFLPKGFSSFIGKPATKLAVYAHDLIHDFYQNNYPGAFGWLESKYFTLALEGSLKYADLIFTNTDFTRMELGRLANKLKFKPPLIITAGIGFTPEKNTAAAKRTSLLLLTSSWPHKLTSRALNFLERWQKQAGFSGRVELVGSLPAGLRLPDINGWQHHLRLSGESYRQLLAETKVLLFFSEYEGFGMPPVEAVIAGACPVFSDLPATREVMEQAGFLFSNDSYESFAQAMNKALNVSEAQIQFWAGQLLERHNWDKVVQQIIRGLELANN